MAGVSGGVPPFVQVRARTGTFRRAGHAFSPEFEIFEHGDLDAGELAALVSEPALEVQGSIDGETYVPIAAADVPEASTGPVAELGRSDDQMVEDLRNQLETANTAIDELEDKLKGSESLVESLNNQVSSHQSALTAAAERLSKAEIEAGKIIAECDDRIKALEALKIEDVSANGEVELTPPAEAKPAKAGGKTKATAQS
ncbi:MAG: hypothetical protein ABIO43_12800 [Sphingomicrobium sp.]